MEKKKLSKREAIILVNNKLSKNLENINTEFSSIIKNSKPPRWWWDINNNSFRSDLHMLLSDQHEKILYYFFVKSGSINNPEELFRQVNNNHITNTSRIYILVGDENFADTRKPTGFPFKKYLKAEIRY